jgi:hypothetical protein
MFPPCVKRTRVTLGVPVHLSAWGSDWGVRSRTEETVDLTVVDLETDAVDGDLRTVTNVQIPNLERATKSRCQVSERPWAAAGAP